LPPRSRRQARAAARVRSARAARARSARRAAPDSVGIHGPAVRARRRPRGRSLGRRVMIQLPRTGLVASSDAGVRACAGTFARVHCITLTQFVEPRLLRWMSAAVDRATFVPRVHADVDPPATDLWLSDHDIRGTMLLLFNDRALFDFIQRVSGCPPIGSFVGSTYRMTAELGHTDSWHDDVYDGRQVALSLNLSPDGYRGGLLQIREKATGAVVHEVANTGFGDAIAFRLAAPIEHRVTNVEPGPSKTAFAGWFRTGERRAPMLLPKS